MDEVNIIKKFDDFDVERVVINYGEDSIIMDKYIMKDYNVYKYSDTYLVLEYGDCYYINVNKIDNIKIRYI